MMCGASAKGLCWCDDEYFYAKAVCDGKSKGCVVCALSVSCPWSDLVCECDVIRRLVDAVSGVRSIHDAGAMAGDGPDGMVVIVQRCPRGGAGV